MPLTFRPLHPHFVAEVTGVDMCVPPDAGTQRAIIEAADAYAVLIFPGQPLTDEQHVAFSRPFGRLETTIKAYRPGFKGRLDPHVADISNLDEDSTLLSPTDRRRMSSLGNRLWHTDYTFKETPGMYSLLSARVIPEDGGETQFTDLRAAYDALPERTQRRLEGLVAEHSLLYSRGTLGFTYRLLMAPPEVIDYVVMHELVHTQIHNHSKTFWNKVAQLMPDYKPRLAWLKKNGKVLM